LIRLKLTGKGLDQGRADTSDEVIHPAGLEIDLWLRRVIDLHNLAQQDPSFVVGSLEA